jgi:hypothetical protein
MGISPKFGDYKVKIYNSLLVSVIIVFVKGHDYGFYAQDVGFTHIFINIHNHTRTRNNNNENHEQQGI